MTPEQAAEQFHQLVVQLDETWMFLCTVLVIFMQAGFSSLEAGLSRSKNSSGVAISNLVDICVAAVLFWLVGYGLLFGASQNGWIGFSQFPFRDPNPATNWETIFFMFQLGCLGLAVTIVSGAVAERMRFIPYLFTAALIGVLIYPVFGHWVWAGLEKYVPGGSDPEYLGWLAKLGFRDFAGSTVIHSTGAWVALAAIMVVGPRKGRFTEDGRLVKIQGHNVSMGALGLFILWLGWFGLTAGHTFAPESSVPIILLNTLLAGAMGGIGGLVMDFIWRHFRNRSRQTEKNAKPPILFSIESAMNGVIAGLVAISASCNLVSQEITLLIGFVGGLVMFWGTLALEWFRLDDVVGAIPAHGFAGVWGTLAVGLFVTDSDIGAQLLGIVVCFVWAFPISFLFLSLVHKLSKVNSIFHPTLSEDEQEEGVNVVEHGAETELDPLVRAIEKKFPEDLVSTTKANKYSVPADQHTVAGQLAGLYNRLLDSRYAIAEAKEKELEAERRASRSKDEFLRHISHEIRTPMQQILGFADRVLKRMKEPANCNDLHIIKRNGLYLLNLMDDFLDLAKIEAGKLQIEPTYFSPIELVRDVVSFMGIRLQHAGVELRAEYVGPIPETILTDHKRLRQILNNLTGNAVKFTEQGCIRVVTQILRSGDEPSIQFDVIDTGIGMDKETEAKLFAPFFQGEVKREMQTGGAGLGLGISKRLAELMGGDIMVACQLGEGCCFTLTVPCGPLDDVPMVLQPHKWRPAQTPDDLPRLDTGEIHLTCKVLLVEDTRDIRRIIYDWLIDAGAQVITAENGQQAVEKALAERFDVILMDMRMPVVDGYQATHQLRVAGYKGPIVALTAHAMKGDEDKCRAAGCDGFATKPLDERQLLECVRRMTVQEEYTDRATDDSLHSALADSRVAKMIPEFLDKLDGGFLQPMKNCFAEQKWDELYELAHQLKGTAGLYGFHQVTPITQRMLDVLRADDHNLESLAQLLDRLIDVCSRLQPGVAPTYKQFCATS